MSSAGQPEQQTLKARVLTGAGWLEGTFHLPKRHAFADYLAHHPWYPMTDVVMAKVGLMPFFALAQHEVLLVAAGPLERASTLEHRSVKATLLLTVGAVDGILDLPASLRLSDFVERTTSFVHVRDANVKVWADPAAAWFDELLVNPRRLVGVTELVAE